MTSLAYRILSRLIDIDWLIAHTVLTREPDFIVWANRDAGLRYLSRWWLIPRNPLINIYLHRIERSDDDRALHDHPWPNLTIVLRGSYLEVLPATQRQNAGWDYSGGTRTVERRSGQSVARLAHWRHRLVVSDGHPGAWTLFITGPVMRRWGFHCRNRWVPWQQFTDARDKGAVGRGCA